MLKPTLFALCGALALTSCQKDESSLNGAERPFKNDATPPVVRITSPADGAVVWDTQLTVEVSDDMAVGSLEIYQDGVLLNSVNMPSQGRPVREHSFTAFYNIGMPDIRTLRAFATDKAGNKAEHQITIYKLVCCGPTP